MTAETKKDDTPEAPAAPDAAAAPELLRFTTPEVVLLLAKTVEAAASKVVKALEGEPDGPTLIDATSRLVELVKSFEYASSALTLPSIQKQIAKQIDEVVKSETRLLRLELDGLKLQMDTAKLMAPR